MNEINEILGTTYGSQKKEFIAASKRLMKDCPRIKKLFDKVRTGKSASWQKVYGRAWNGKEYFCSEELEIINVVDRIGTGDAYPAGVIYRLQHYDDQETINFANAACALKTYHCWGC